MRADKGPRARLAQLSTVVHGLRAGATSWIAYAVLASASFALFPRSSVQAQAAWSSEEPCLPEEADGSRSLRGHAFIPFAELPFPFVTTRVSSQTGLGLVNLESVPVVNVGFLEQDAQLAAFAQTFLFDLALWRFLALSAGFGVANAVGINDSGAFNLGINYAVGGTLGLVARLAHGARWYLSLRTDYGALRAEAVLPVALTQTAVIQDDRVVFDLGSLTRGGKVFRSSTALMFAVSPVRWLGLQASVGYNFLRAEIERPDVTRHYLVLGLGSSLRFDKWHVPLAVLLGGNLRMRAGDEEALFFPTVESSGSVLGNLEAGLLYSDVKFLDVGLQASFRLSSHDRRSQIQVVLNHFW